MVGLVVSCEATVYYSYSVSFCFIIKKGFVKRNRGSIVVSHNPRLLNATWAFLSTESLPEATSWKYNLHPFGAVQMDIGVRQ